MNSNTQTHCSLALRRQWVFGSGGSTTSPPSPSPGPSELLKTATDRLAEVSAQRGAPVSRVRNVRIALHRSSKRVYIFPAHEEDPDRIAIRPEKSAGWINLISLLGAVGITVPVGYRDRFRVETHLSSGLTQR